MPLIGVTVLPVSPSVRDSPASSFLSRLSQLYPSEVHEPFHVDHRLFVSTTSLLPGANQKDRRFTQILTTSHAPEITFVTTSLAVTSADSGTIIIPTSSVDSFSQLIITKFQPQWAHRQSLYVEGARIKLQVPGKNDWTISLGDLRVATSSPGSAGTGGTGNIRGVLIELHHSAEETLVTNGGNADDLGDYEISFRDLIKSLFRDIGDYKFDELKIVLTRVSDDTQANLQHEINTAICRSYTTLFRGSRT